MELCFGGTSGDFLADRRFNLAMDLAEGGDLTAAVDLLKDALRMTPSWPPLHFHLGDILRQQGRMSGAEKALRTYLSLDPDDRMGAGIKLALMGVEPVPETMPEDYVRVLFDQYAPKFETCLLDNLEYKTPAFIAEAVRKIRSSCSFPRILDLGCGTGLAALPFREEGVWIEGVDLSAGMVREAETKGIYNALHVAGLEPFLKREMEPFDLILSADVFVYVGDLEGIFKAVSARMAPEGLFAFSVQRLAEGGAWTLGNDHRYAHGQVYIEACAEKAGLRILSCTNVVLRKDAGQPVEGVVFVCGS